MNTIFAQCSGMGKAGISVYRISGPNTISVLEKLTCNDDISSWQARKMYLRKIFHPKTNLPIDTAMLVYFNKTSSFTGESSAEIHTHGSIAVMKLLYQALASMNNLRLAEPGEFAKRAFLNGKFSLTVAEGLADLMEAETELQHKQAFRQMDGGLELIYSNWRSQLLTTISLLEAYIEFPDEEIPLETTYNIKNKINNLCQEITAHLKDNNRGERLRHGLKVVIIGKPNVGKSSLINFFLKREVAIVSHIPGTTRDIIEARVDIAGYPIILQDTAGIRDNTLDEIEQIGIKKTKEAINTADIKIIMYDVVEFNEQDINPFLDFMDSATIVLFNKMDKKTENDYTSVSYAVPKQTSKNILYVSVKTGRNTDLLIELIVRIAEQIANPSENPQITRERHRTQLSYALEVLSNLNFHNELILLVEDIRMTTKYLEKIIGNITVNEILDEVFSSFCIGK